MKESFFEYCNGSRIEIDIPEKFHYKEGNIENGYVIEDEAGNQYVRIPSGYTPEGIYVRGFWISRYEISIDSKGIPHSVANLYPVVNVNYYSAEEIAKKVNGYLPSAIHYNRICMWLVESGAATFENVYVNAIEMRNNSLASLKEKTGTNQDFMVNHIDNFWGNNYIWTTEKSEVNSSFKVIRGGASRFCNTDKNDSPASCRLWIRPEDGWNKLTLRIVKLDEYDEE